MPPDGADGKTDRRRVVPILERASGYVREHPRQLSVGVVVIGRRIGRRSSKNSHDRVLIHPAADISAVNRVEAGGPRQIQTTRSRNQARAGVVVRQTQSVSAIDQIADRRRRRGTGDRRETAVPVAVEIPICSTDAGHLHARHEADF